MSGDGYVPSWRRESTSAFRSRDDYPDSFPADARRERGGDVRGRDMVTVPEPPGAGPDSHADRERWDETRCPMVFASAGATGLGGGGVDYRLTVDGSGHYVIALDAERFPAEDKRVSVTVFGVWETDTETYDADVIDAGPLTLRTEATVADDGEGTLYRVLVHGCLACESGGLCPTHAHDLARELGGAGR